MVHFSRREVLAAGVASAAWVVGGPVLTGRSTAVPRFPGDPGPDRLYYGASTDRPLRPWEAELGARLAVHRTYHRASRAARLIRRSRYDVAAGRLPHVSTKCPGNWASVAAGHHDGWLRRVARGLGGVAGPVFLTVHHEPENDRSAHGRRARDFVAMQERVIRLFALRAPNVTVVPVLQGWSFWGGRTDPGRWQVPAAKVVGVDLYNPFSSTDDRWVPFADRLERFQGYASGRPIVIGEHGCRDDPSDPSRGASWLLDAHAAARAQNVVSLSYFNSGRNSPDGSWALDGQRAEAFAANLASPCTARLAGA